ncbi:MAG: hypothetical protein AAF242_10885 [Bacteroidota bacterium]
MFSTLPQFFRDYGLSCDVRTLLLLRKATEKGLVKTLGDMYQVLKGIIVNEPRDIGPFTRAYYKYFLNIEVRPGESLDDAIRRSETFKEWRNQYLEEADRDIEFSTEELINRFLDQVHMTHYDIKEIIDGRELFDKNDPDQTDQVDPNDPGTISPRELDKMADYSDISLKELLERLERIKGQQKDRHGGGDHWVGTGGVSPYGHGGAAKGGIRVGGSGGGKMARKVIGDPNFYPVDLDAIINDNNVDAALASLKGVIEESAREKLDIPKTIKTGLKRGSLFLPELEHEKDEKLQVLVLIDNGGFSMHPYIKSVQDLFKKMKTRFAHDLEVFYFHNSIYGVVYEDAARMKVLPLKRFLDKDEKYRVFIIGDAAMAPYELTASSIRGLQSIQKKFKRSVWLNPEPKQYWHHTYTIQAIKQIFPMFPLTPRGIEQAVREMNRKYK